MQQKLNPYKPSLHVTFDHAEDPDVQATHQQLWWPAWFIVVIAGLNVAFDMVLIADHAISLYHGFSRVGVHYPINALTIHALQCVGGFAMFRMRFFRLAQVSAVTCSIPCLSPFCVIGIPFGFFAVHVLWLPETRRCFELVRSQHSGER